MGDYKDLNVWKISIDLVKDIYQLTSKFPSKEKFGLISQIQRAAVSIPSNIAEGANRNSNKEFIQFLFIALGSASEVETQLIIANKLGYTHNINDELNEITKIRKMLNALIRSLRNKE